MQIQFFPTEALIELRRNVLRPGMDFSHVMYHEDSDPSTFHIGIEMDGKLVGCITAFQATNPDLEQPIQYRLRALCVDENYRNRGFARALVQYALDEVQRRGAQAVWFTARVHLIPFYKSFGCTDYGEHFLIPNSCMHVKMYKIISK